MDSEKKGAVAHASAAVKAATDALAKVSADAETKNARVAELEAQLKAAQDANRPRPGANGGNASGDRFPQFAAKAASASLDKYGHVVIGLSEREQKAFSWGNLFTYYATGDREVAAFELECQKAAKELDAKVRRKTATFGSDPNMGFLVTPEFMPGYIDLLRSATFLDSLGVQRYTGLHSSPFVKPRITGEGSAGWLTAEGTAATQTDGSSDQIMAWPKTAYASRQLSLKLIDDGPAVIDSIIRKGVVETIKRLVEKAIIEGTGVSGQPIGVNNITGINTVAFTSATGDEKQQKLMEMIWAIATDNVPLNGLAWVMSPLVMSNLERVLKATSSATATANLASGELLSLTYGAPSTDGSGFKPLLGGFPVHMSTNITASTTSILTLAAWPEVSYYEWGSPTLVFEKGGKTNALAREATYVMFQDVDVNVDHPEAICTGTAFTY